MVRLDFLAGSYDDLNSFGNGAFRVDPRVMSSIGWASNRSKNFSFGGRLGYMGEELGGIQAVILYMPPGDPMIVWLLT